MNYKVITRKNPRDLEAPPKYYAQIVRPPSISLDKLANRISEISPVSDLDIKAVLITLTKVLPEYFIEGATVNMGDLGYFQTTLRSNGADNEDDFSSDLIKGFSVNYNESSQVKEKYKTVKYNKVQV